MNADPQSRPAPRRVERLGFQRAYLPPGAEIGAPNEAVIQALACADELVVALDFTLIGDSLLFMSVVQACHEAYLLLRGCHPIWIIAGAHGELLRRCPLLAQALVFNTTKELSAYAGASGRRLFVVTDSTSLTLPSPAFIYRKSDRPYPVFVETFKDGGEREHRALPARYYIAFELALGRLLSSDPSTSHPGFLFPDDPGLETAFAQPDVFSADLSTNRLCAIVATTSLPAKKQFGVSRFLQVTTALTTRYHHQLTIVLVVSPSMAEVNDETSTRALDPQRRRTGWLVCNSSRLEELGYLFARAELVIGNDTGLTHLAGLSRRMPPHRPPQVIQLYSRHDYTRWTSGRDNVHPLFTAFSMYLRNNNFATVTDGIDDSEWTESATAASIDPDEVVVLAHHLLTHSSARAEAREADGHGPDDAH